MSRKNKSWFEVDKRGLAKVIARKGMSFCLYELLANAFDEQVTEVDAMLGRQDNRNCVLSVRDDSPEGFADLTHAWTMFAESAKKSKAEVRGRFNIGDKLVLSLAREASIATTKGTVRFDESGRQLSRTHTDSGSAISLVLPMTAEQYAKVCEDATRIIPPAGVRFLFNGTLVARPDAVATIAASLPTELAGADGVLHRTQRQTAVEIFEAAEVGGGWLLELGIPVMPTGDRWTYNVLQKVPLTLDRESVPDSFLRSVRVLVFNALAERLCLHDVNSEWVAAAAEHPSADPAALRRFADLKLGEHRVSYDPSDMEANSRAVAAGYRVIHGSMLSKGAWANLRRAEAIRPAGQVTPGPKTWTGEGNPNAEPFDDWIPEQNWTTGMKQIAEYAQWLYRRLLGRGVDVRFCATAHHLGGASYGAGTLIFNKLRLGNDFFEHGISEAVDALLIHEAAHEYEANHLSEAFHEWLCKLSAKLKRLALAEPERFREFHSGRIMKRATTEKT